MTQQPSIVLHPAIRAYFQQRGMVDEEEIAAYLFPTLAELPDPSLLQSMRQAVALIVQALEEQWDILVWGDYDVDGITATALLVRFFQDLGVAVQHHIPNRLTEGYGLNKRRLTSLAKRMKAQKLLITVDCGIANHLEVQVAKKLGFEVIVTDHHNLAGSIPAAGAVINPKQRDCTFPGKELAGVGVAFYLAAAVRSKLNKHGNKESSKINLKSFLDMVSIGTIADVMPLVGINRVLAKGGFEVLGQGRRKGISFLLHELGLNPTLMSGENVSFQIAPVINAAGRLGQPEVALELLLCQDEGSLKRLTDQLIELNTKRKELALRDLENALSMVDSLSIERHKCIVVSGPFHEGILGITAARLVELFRVPALVCTQTENADGLLKGSARAPLGFHLYEAMERCRSCLHSFGGHAAAAGFSVQKEMVPALLRDLAAVANEDSARNDRLSTETRPLPLAIDEALDHRLLDNLAQLEPTGEGNPKPIFYDDRVTLVSLSRFGRDKEHFRALVRGRYQNVPVIGFGLGDKADDIDTSSSCVLSYTHMIDSYNGKASWKIRAENIWQ